MPLCNYLLQARTHRQPVIHHATALSRNLKGSTALLMSAVPYTTEILSLLCPEAAVVFLTKELWLEMAVQ